MSRLILLILIWLATGGGVRAADCELGDAPYRANSSYVGVIVYDTTILGACAMAERAANFQYGSGSVTGAYHETPQPDTYGGTANCLLTGLGEVIPVVITDTGCTVPSTGGGTSTGTISTVSVVVSPAPPSSENIADYTEIFAAMTLGIVLLWGVKKILQIFDNHHEG